LNLHDVPDRPAPRNLNFEVFARLNRELFANTAPRVDLPPPEDVITRDTILAAADRLRENLRTPPMRVGALPQPVRAWEEPLADPQLNFRTYHATETAIRVIGEIYELHARLQSYNMLAGRENRLAIQVTPQEYQELQVSASPNGDNPIHIDWGTGTMSVMGMTVLPSR